MRTKELIRLLEEQDPESLVKVSSDRWSPKRYDVLFMSIFEGQIVLEVE